MIDFHCHLDLYRYPELAVQEADRAGIYVLCVTTTPKAWTKTSALCANRRRIRTGLGLHPELAGDREDELSLFEQFATSTRYFGEIGLDGSPQYKDVQPTQLRVFSSILRMAAISGGKVLSIHSRRAIDEVLSCLAKEPAAGTPILHWFSGSQVQLRAAIAQGCWFSCGPAMLRSAKGRAIAKALPRDKVLTETDGPFGRNGSRPLQPEDSWQAVSMLADIWSVDPTEVVSSLRRNLENLTASQSS